MADPAPPQVKVVFERSPTCQVTPASGMWGAPLPDGLLSVQFYIERAAPPKSVTMQQQGPVLVQVAQEPDGTIIRYVVAEVVMSPATAFQLRGLINNMFKALNIDTEQLDPEKRSAETAKP
jgi:hypothetical protein